MYGIVLGVAPFHVGLLVLLVIQPAFSILSVHWPGCRLIVLSADSVEFRPDVMCQYEHTWSLYCWALLFIILLDTVNSGSMQFAKNYVVFWLQNRNL